MAKFGGSGTAKQACLKRRYVVFSAMRGAYRNDQHYYVCRDSLLILCSKSTALLHSDELI